MPMSKKKRGWVAIAAAIVLLIAGGAWLAFGSRPAQEQPLSGQLAEASQGMDEIIIYAELDAQKHLFTVEQTFHLTSRADVPRDLLVLRTWPNAFHKPDTSPVSGNRDLCPAGFSAGSLVVDEALVEIGNGQEPLQHRYLDEGKTVLSLPLMQPWQPGETLQVTLRYTVHFPHLQYRFGWWEDTFMAGQAFAVPALWQNGAYRTDAYPAIGDPLSGECANYHLTLKVPKGYACTATGSCTQSTAGQDGTVVYQIDALAVREVGLVVSRDLKRAQRNIDGVLVEAWAPEQAQAHTMLEITCDALQSFSKRYGSYPYPSYTVCAVPMGVSGAEYPGLAMVASSLTQSAGKELEYAIVHETAHQWWYALVGSDASTHPWMDEALCEFSLLEYVEDRYGKAAREELRQSRIETSMRVTVAGQATPGAPLDYFETGTDYMVLVYGRAVSLLCAMDDWTGGKLADTLKQYAQQYAFSIADRDDFTELVYSTTGLDMEPLMMDYLDTYLK